VTLIAARTFQEYYIHPVTDFSIKSDGNKFPGVRPIRGFFPTKVRVIRLCLYNTGWQTIAYNCMYMVLSSVCLCLSIFTYCLFFTALWRINVFINSKPKWEVFTAHSILGNE